MIGKRSKFSDVLTQGSQTCFVASTPHEMNPPKLRETDLCTTDQVYQSFGCEFNFLVPRRLDTRSCIIS